MKQWSLIGSTAERCGVPGGLYLLNDDRRQGWARQHRATAGPTDATRRSCRAAQSGHLFPATAFPMPASVLPPVPVVVPRRSARRRKRSDGGS